MMMKGMTRHFNRVNCEQSAAYMGVLYEARSANQPLLAKKQESNRNLLRQPASSLKPTSQRSFSVSRRLIRGHSASVSGFLSKSQVQW